jgi:hypothetical protein
MNRYRRHRGQTDARGPQNPHPVKKENTQPLVAKGVEIFLFPFVVLFPFFFLREGVGGGFSFFFPFSFWLWVFQILGTEREKPSLKVQEKKRAFCVTAR